MFFFIVDIHFCRPIGTILNILSHPPMIQYTIHFQILKLDNDLIVHLLEQPLQQLIKGSKKKN